MPDGDLAEVVDRALDYGAEVVARRIAEARQSRRARALAPGTVPAPELFDAMKLRS